MLLPHISLRKLFFFFIDPNAITYTHTTGHYAQLDLFLNIKLVN